MRLAGPALLTLFVSLGACGDGVDERYDTQGHELTPQQATPKTDTPKGETPHDDGATAHELTTPILEHFHTTISGSNAGYSGGSSMIKVGDEWFASGFDNDSDPQQAERGAIWRSSDLENWRRTGFDISEGEDQQGIAQLLGVDGTVLAFGVDFGRTGTNTLGDAVVWRSDDKAESFEEVELGGRGAVAQAVFVDGVVWAVGVNSNDGFVTGQIWRSDDVGATWEALDPTVVGANGDDLPLGPLVAMVASGGDLIAVGSTTVTDPQRDGEKMTEDEWIGFIDALEPIDVGLWKSDDNGAHWQAGAADGVAGERGYQLANAATQVGDRLVLAGEVSSAADSHRYQPILWSCDLELEQCDAHVPYNADFDFTSATLANDNGVVVFAIRGVDFDDLHQSGRVGFFDPVSNRIVTAPLEGKIEQIEFIYVDEDADLIYFLGRDPNTNLMHVASTTAP